MQSHLRLFPYHNDLRNVTFFENCNWSGLFYTNHIEKLHCIRDCLTLLVLWGKVQNLIKNHNCNIDRRG